MARSKPAWSPLSERRRWQATAAYWRGVPVTMIGRPAFVDAVKQAGLFMDTVHFQEAVQVAASQEMSCARGADFVLFCVKTTDTAEAAKELAEYVSPLTVVISLQNGVNNAEEIRKASGLEVVSAVVYVAAAMAAAGYVKHLG